MMIASVFAVLVAQGGTSLDREIAKAIRGKELNGPEFSEALETVLQRFSGYDSHGYSVSASLGDERAVWVWADEYTGERQEYVFIWPDRRGNHVQTVYRYAVPQNPDPWHPKLPMSADGEVYWRGDRLVVAGYDERFTNRGRPSVYLYRLKGGRWKLMQHLQGGPFGEATFVRSRGAVNPDRVAVDIAGFPYHLSVPSAGPFLEFRETWVYRGGKYRRGAAKMAATALAELDRLGGYVEAHRRAAFDRRLKFGMRGRLWKALSNYEFVTYDEPFGDGVHSQRYLVGDRTRVVLEKKRGRWVVSRVERVKG